MIKMKFIPTRHITEDRLDRMVYIATTIGFGEVIHTAILTDERGARYHCLTSTGVILIKALDMETVLTAFIAKLSQIEKLYVSPTQIPLSVLSVAKRNVRHLNNKEYQSYSK